MKIDKVVVGYLQCNCYIITKGTDTLIIDPGDESEKIISMVTDKKVIGILITHHHFDHIQALEAIKTKYKVPVYDKTNLKEYNKIGAFDFYTIDTKGHTSDSVTYYFKDDKVMFTGDFLFKESIGRTDLDTGNRLDMQESINKIKKYDPDIKIFPGHGESSVLGYEFKNNIYLKGD